MVAGDWKSLPQAVANTGTMEMGIPRDIDWVLLSVHRQEWPALASLVRRQRETGCALVLVPRNLDECAFFSKVLADTGVPTLTWPEIKGGSVSVVREFGQVGAIVSRSRAVVMGGSFCKVGVHDFWEPLRAGCAVLVGPNLDPQRVALEQLFGEGVAGRMRPSEVDPGTSFHDPDRIRAYLEKLYVPQREGFAAFGSWLHGVRESSLNFS